MEEDSLIGIFDLMAEDDSRIRQVLDWISENPEVTTGELFAKVIEVFKRVEGFLE